MLPNETFPFIILQNELLKHYGLTCSFWQRGDTCLHLKALHISSLGLLFIVLDAIVFAVVIIHYANDSAVLSNEK